MLLLGGESDGEDAALAAQGRCSVAFGCGGPDAGARDAERGLEEEE